MPDEFPQPPPQLQGMGGPTPTGPTRLGVSSAGRSLTSEDIEFITVNDADVRGAMLVVGLPTEADEGSLAAHYLLTRLEMQLMGAFHSERLPPLAVSESGLVLDPVQVWRGEAACGPDGKCDQILILKSDVPLESHVAGPLAAAVSRWASERGVGLIIGFDAYDAGTTEGGMFVGSSISAFAIAKELGVGPLPHKLLNGFSAALHTSANRDGLSAITLFSPAGGPDEAVGTAGASLLRAAPLLPPLEFEKDEVESRLREIHTVLQRMADDAYRAQRLETAKGYV